MADKKFFSVFTPSQTDPKDLEAIFVQRHALLKDAVERVRESAESANKHHLLFAGPRGSGKTHFVTLLVHRLTEAGDLEDKLDIAWLNEDETCTTLLEFLIKIYRALTKRYPDQYPESELNPAYDLAPEAALEYVGETLLKLREGRAILVVLENLDALFGALEASGQKQLRAFIQEHPVFATVATAQALVDDLTDRSGPFFGFFQTEHMRPLTRKEAAQLLEKIARENGQVDVARFLQTPRGRARVRALHHLSGGNHRIYVVLSQFISFDNIDELVAPFKEMVDTLTPYYQERIRALSPMQRKIVEYLCQCEGTVPVKEIGRHLFAKHQSVSSQLKDLRDKGYLKSSQRGRESLYEVSEPLMRICVEVKENQDYAPLKLLIDFVRVWYEDEEIGERLERYQEGISEARRYLEAALEKNSNEGNLRQRILVDGIRENATSTLRAEDVESLCGRLGKLPEEVALAYQSFADGSLDEAVELLSEFIPSAEVEHKAEALSLRATVFRSKRDFENVILNCTEIIELDGAPPEQVAIALRFRGVTHGQQGDVDKEIADYTAAIELDGAPPEQVAIALRFRGVTHGQQGDFDKEIADYTAAIELDGAPPEQVAIALRDRGFTHGQQGDVDKQIADYTAAIELDGAPPEQVAIALRDRGVTHGQQGDVDKKIADYTAAIELDGAPPEQVAIALRFRGFTHGQQGDVDKQIADYTAAIELDGAPPEQVAIALHNRGFTHGQQGDVDKQIADYTAAIELDGAPPEQVAIALRFRGVTHGQQGDVDKEIADYTAAIELDGAPPEQIAKALHNRGVTHGQQGDVDKEIADYTAAIELDGAPPEQVAIALRNRGFTHGQQGDVDKEIADYTAAIELDGAPPEQVAIALRDRGFTHGQQGDFDKEIADYTAAIELDGAPPEQVAIALRDRGVTHGQQGDVDKEIADYTAAIELDGAPPEQIAWALKSRGVTRFEQRELDRSMEDFQMVLEMGSEIGDEVTIDSHLAIAEIRFDQGRWDEGFPALAEGLKTAKQSGANHYGDIKSLIALAFDAGFGREELLRKVATFVELASENEAHAALGEALVQHLGSLHQAADSPGSDQLERWQSAWQNAAEGVRELAIPMRLFRTGIRFIGSKERDEAILLDLNSNDRELLRQALGLEEKD